MANEIPVRQPGDARHIVRARLKGAPVDAVQLVGLLTSELVTNALVHGAGDPALVLGVDEIQRTIRVEVHDAEPTLDIHPLHGEPSRTKGRGLAIVDALATNWGVEPAGTARPYGSSSGFKGTRVRPGESPRTLAMSTRCAQSVDLSGRPSVRKWAFRGWPPRTTKPRPLRVDGTSYARLAGFLRHFYPTCRVLNRRRHAPRHGRSTPTRFWNSSRMYRSGVPHPCTHERRACSQVEKDRPTSGPSPGPCSVGIGFKKDAHNARHAQPGTDQARPVPCPILRLTSGGQESHEWHGPWRSHRRPPSQQDCTGDRERDTDAERLSRQVLPNRHGTVVGGRTGEPDGRTFEGAIAVEFPCATQDGISLCLDRNRHEFLFEVW